MIAIPKRRNSPVSHLFVHADRAVPRAVVERAREVVLRAVSGSRRPMLYGRITLRVDGTPPRANASAALDMNGRVVRAHGDAETLRDAIDVLDARLRRRLEELHSRSSSPVRGGSAPRPRAGSRPRAS